MRAHGSTLVRVTSSWLTGVVVLGLVFVTSSAHVARIAAAPVAAVVSSSPTLVRTGWTATASSQETANESDVAANVLDGSATTFWHSEYGSGTQTLPQWIQLDMHTTQPVAGLNYLPRPSANRNGRIGQYQITLSTDGTTWTTPVATGTWADDATVKTATFAPATTRYVRLTALTEAGNRGQWASAAELDLLGPPPALDRTGWTATASSQETARQSDAAANVLDGSATTFWHSEYGSGTQRLPQWIQLDLQTAQPVSQLAYTPRARGVNGRIGQYQITVSTDGTTWSPPVATGTWADDATVKTVSFTTVTTRYVRLTALTEAGNRGQWASAAELNLYGAGTVGASTGSWSATIGFPLVPAAAALLPGDKVLVWSSQFADNYTNGHGSTQTAILDLDTMTVSQKTVFTTGHDMFCPGVAILADGRIMVTGGNDAAKTSIYDPATDTWAAGPPMNIARGYQSMTLLPTGEVFTIGGSWSGGRGGKSGEVWSAAGGWRLLSGVPVTPILTADPAGVFRADNHAWLFPMSGGRLLQAGPSKVMHWITTTGNGSITSAGARADSADAMNGSSVYYDVDKLVTLGGATAYQDVDATNRAYTIDVSGATAKVARTSDMAYQRSFQNSVVLPDGSVLVVGGQTHPVPFSDATSIFVPELWSPATGTFTPLAPAPTPRNYHSWALLLPDGRVISGGGGLCGTNCATNHPDAQIFTPPYLLNPDGTAATRPTVTDVPATATAGSTITVGASAGVTSFALMRYGEATHTVDDDQRRIPLPIVSSSGTSFTLRLPADRGVVLPGPYMLFALDAHGVPSVSQRVLVS